MTTPETDMNAAHDNAPPRSLEDIQDAIVEQLHAGEPVDRQAILENHSEHATALEQFFAVVDLMEAGPAPERQAPTRLGEFRIVREVGRGGMGVVYEAEQPSLRRHVALKVLPPALQNDRRLLQRFRREAEAAGRLRHRNIVPVFSFGEAGGAPFFAMELVNGPSLAEVLRRRRIEDDAGLPTDPGEYRAWAVETVAQIADALGYAHRQGVLHRDVKPANIMLDESGAPRLTDFGLALDLEATSLSVSGEIFGSPRYMSPEQAFRRQAPIDARTDVYSLAVTLYELLTLRLPYDGVTGSEILMALEKGRMHPLRKADPGASPALEAVLTKALQLDPDRRYASADEFAEDLRAALAGNSVAAPRHRLRRRLLIATAAVVLVLAGAAAYDEWAHPMTWDNPLNVPVSAPGVGPWVRMPSPAAIRSLADGTHPDGTAALKRWFTSSLEHRSILSRSDPAFAQGALAFPLSASWKDLLGDDIVALATLEFSIDGGPWAQSPGQPSMQIPIVGGGGLSTYSSRYRLHDTLSEALQRDSFSLAHRLSLRILRKPAGLEILPLDKSAHDYESGTLVSWRFEPRTIFVYDDYPADYPERVSNPELDADMQLTYTPTGVDYVRTGSVGPSGKSLALTLYFVFEAGRQLVPIASSVDLYAPDQDTVMATAVYATKGLVDGTFKHSTGSHFYLPDAPTPEQQAFLLDLTTGQLDSVRLVFRPSRKTALEEPSFDSYWGGTLDVTVPLTMKKSS